DLILGRVKRCVLHFGAYTLCNTHAGYSACARQEHAKFFPADPADQITLPRHILKRESDQLQGAVTDAVAKRIVDRLEVVGIDNEQGAGFDTGTADLHGFKNRLMVEKTGHVVDPRPCL